ncbi:uncharacterized protein LOC143497996 isoform X3 [Brachyhypopomus gauderio]|uniref:uncharacterized protein LOC143497996 isoform X3 n=1 Tax=Brachyhypopomus gauderio TaxID=698409 RepID=UPI0040410E25
MVFSAPSFHHPANTGTNPGMSRWFFLIIMVLAVEQYSLFCSLPSSVVSVEVTTISTIMEFSTEGATISQKTQPSWLSSTTAFEIIRAHLHEPASLPCYHKCSGNLEWMTSNDQTILATCDQRNHCWTQEGFQMSSEQFKEGNLSLTVTSADHSKKRWYSAFCNGQKVCYCSLLIQPSYSSINHMIGQTLVLDLLTMVPVKVTFEGVDTSGYCTLNGRSQKCTPEYQDRVRVIGNFLLLTALTPSDTGFCTVHEVETGDLVTNITTAVMAKNIKKKDFVSPLEAETIDILRISSGTFNGTWRDCWKEGYDTAVKWTVPVSLLAGILIGILIVICFLVLKKKCKNVCNVGEELNRGRPNVSGADEMNETNCLTIFDNAQQGHQLRTG